MYMPLRILSGYLKDYNFMNFSFDLLSSNRHDRNIIIDFYV
jgi:hypothetical protein